MVYKKKKKKTIPETHPYLIKEWHPIKNENLVPEDLTYGSNKRVWWKCTKCKHVWEASVKSRAANNNGCPGCSGRDVTNKNRLSLLFPHLVEEWDFIRNGDIRPESISKGSDKKVWWKCIECGYSWKTSVYNRTAGKGCAKCAKDRQIKLRLKNLCDKKGSLFDKCPDLVDEWDFVKNKDLNPQEITCGSDKFVWWYCKNCGYSWKARVYSRVNGSGCAVCCGRVVSKNNRLSTLFPNLVAEWDVIKNKNGPEEVSYGSNKKVWWVCNECNYSWKAVVGARAIQGKGCPKCSTGSISNVSQQWLDDLKVEIKEHYIKNLGFRVDGFDPETNTVYEFLGDYWHGNPEVYSAGDINPTNKKSFGQLYQETIERIDLLKENGYNVVYIWEKDFKGI